jgi:dynein heavy chain
VRRTYCDQLVTALEAERCLDLAKETARRLLGPWALPEDLFVEPCLFTSFATPTLEDAADSGPRQKEGAYLAVADLPTLRLLLHEKLRDYNEAGGHAAMELVLFDDALGHVCRLARILSRPRGNALLVGGNGVGKASLAKLAAFCVGLDLHVLGDARHATCDFGWGPRRRFPGRAA